jgi:malate dehydrogenase (oxaloacetate-decarboxylating)
MKEKEKSLWYREKYNGLIGVQSKVPIRDRSVLSLVYTPGVAEPCRAIEKDPKTSFDYTCRGNTVALITDGSRVLGLGDKGPLAAMPVLEGKSVIFKTFANVDAFPICLKTRDVDEIVQTVSLLAPTFGAVCVEDIDAPKCFQVENMLIRSLNIPVFHNDQHGAAIMVLAGLINAGKIVRKKLRKMKVVIAGSGAAGIAIAKLLLSVGISRIILCDTHGAIYKYRTEGMNWAKFEIAKMTNELAEMGPLVKVIKGADVFIGASGKGTLTPEMIQSMNTDPIVFALSTPEPEITPAEAKKAGARIVGTSLPESINELNVAMVFPGIFRGILDVFAREINTEMKLAAAYALASTVGGEKFQEENVLPRIFDFRVAPIIAGAVAKAAIDTGVARRVVDPEEIIKKTESYVYEGYQAPPVKESRKDLKTQSLELHKRYRGVIEIKAKIPVKDHYILELLYLPPRSADPILKIIKNPKVVYDYTSKGNLISVISDGSAVLGLGNIGARAALPVMEGKCVLFHTFGGVEAYPICLGTQDPDELIRTISYISTPFGGINLEDISAPRCFYVERKLSEMLDIPVFHDDQHGTAVVLLAGLTNALKIVGKKLSEIKVVVSGAGAAAIAVTKILLSAGAKNIILCDRHGAIYHGREAGMNWIKVEMAVITNPERLMGEIKDVVKGSDVFLGFSAPGIMTTSMVKSMAKDPIVFAMANPVPEIMPEEAKAGGARIVGTGRSDYPNQVNNSLGFPGIFRGALGVRARTINEAMKLAAAQALAEAIPEAELSEEKVIPEMMDFRVPPKVSAAVARAAIKTGVAQKIVDPEEIEQAHLSFLYEGQLPKIG